MALNKNFSIICGWFVNNNFIHFGEDKSKSIFFGSRQEIKNSKPLNIQYNFASIYSSIHLSIQRLHPWWNPVRRISGLFVSQNRFLNVPLRKLLWNAVIQAFFGHACNAWHPNVNKKLKTRLEAAEKYMHKILRKVDWQIWHNFEK